LKCLIEPLEEIYHAKQSEKQNPKSEYRNPKQTPRRENLKSENPKHESE
jgi:hypothetical protein